MPEFPDLVPDAGELVVERPRVGSLGAVERWEQVRGALANSLVLAALLAVVAIGAGWFWYRAGLHQHRPVAARAHAAPKAPGGRVVADPVTPAGELIVHVSGAVAHPGLYHLPAGSRVVDALTAAGGPVVDADTDRVNLAARVVDGQHLVVPRRGEPIASDAGGAATSGELTGPISLNVASAEQLESLPHVGPALARAIIDYRERHGGFRAVHELRNIRGIGERVYADLVDRVTV